mgnify:CR=1 FL=1
MYRTALYLYAVEGAEHSRVELIRNTEQLGEGTNTNVVAGIKLWDQKKNMIQVEHEGGGE